MIKQCVFWNIKCQNFTALLGLPCGCAEYSNMRRICGSCGWCASACIRMDWPTPTATSDQSVNMFEAELICKELRRVIIVACLVMSGGQLASFLDTTQRAFSKHQTIFLFGRKAKCLCDLVLFTLWQNLEQICLESISQIHPCAAPWSLKLSRKITEAGKGQTTF